MRRLVQPIIILLYIPLRVILTASCLAKIIWSHDWDAMSNVALYVYCIGTLALHYFLLFKAENRKLCTWAGRICIVCIDILLTLPPLILYFGALVVEGFIINPWDVFVLQIVMLSVRIADLRAFRGRLGKES